MVKPGSQNHRIVEALKAGGWMTTAEIHQAAGFSRLNSRVAELRAHGYDIPCRPIEGARPGPHAQEYRLAGTPDETTGAGSGHGAQRDAATGSVCPVETPETVTVSVVSSDVPAVPAVTSPVASDYIQLRLVA